MTKANDIFSGGLGRKGRIAAWAVAIGVAGVWSYMENRDNFQVFSADERGQWNTKQKQKAAAADAKKE